MNIFIVGPGCSGSTLFYNIIRLILEENSIEYNIRNAMLNIDSKSAKITLHKRHVLSNDLIDKESIYFLTRRDIRSLCSCSRRRWPNSTVNIIEQAVKEVDSFYQWQMVCAKYELITVYLQYEQYILDPKKKIDKISKSLSLSCDIKNIIKEINKINHNNTKSLMDINNIGSKKIDDFSYLTTGEIKKLEMYFPWWIYKGERL